MALWFEGMENGKACFIERRGSGLMTSGSYLSDGAERERCRGWHGLQRATVFCQLRDS